MEFRNHQAKMRHHYQSLAGNPLAMLLFFVVMLVILIPVILLILAVGVISLLLLPIRLLIARLRGDVPRAPSPFPPAGGPGPFRPAPDADPDMPSGPVIDVEVTDSKTTG